MNNKTQITEWLDRMPGEISGEANIKRTRIGDILAKMPKTGADKLKVVRHWEELGEDLSLQEIIKASGWKCASCGSTPDEFDRCCGNVVEVLSDPKAQKLLDLLIDTIKPTQAKSEEPKLYTCECGTQYDICDTLDCPNCGKPLF